MGTATLEVLLREAENLEVIDVEVLVPFFVQFDVGFPDLFCLLPVERWIVDAPGDSRLDGII